MNQKDVVVQILGWRFSVNTALSKLNLTSKSVVTSDRMSGIKLQQRYTNEGK